LIGLGQTDRQTLWIFRANFSHITLSFRKGNIAFSNLNHRFQQLITSSSRIRYEINEINRNFSTTKELFFNQSKEIKHQIYSLYFQLLKESMNEFLPLFIIDCYSYTNLQSIVIEDIEKDQLISLLNHLSIN